jgi:cellulose synthase/poly-beta-1,6-N-acetylglucosamine synthase-like glycosyltransferase
MAEALAEATSEPGTKAMVTKKARDLQARAGQLESHTKTQTEGVSLGAVIEADDSFKEGFLTDIRANWQGRQPPQTHGEEFTHMRYLPVLPGDPLKFVTEGYKLRACQMNRRIKFLINITMYNEEAHEMNDTLQAVCDNLEFMEQINQGKRAIWQQAMTIIVSDGRQKMNTGTKEWMTKRGMFDENSMTLNEQGLPKQPMNHVFEYTAQLENQTQGGNRDPLQIVFSLKENNGGKQHSQLWFFYAFAAQLNPKYCVLIDVGTKAAKTAIYRLIRSMDENPYTAGVCGEIAVENPFGPEMWIGGGKGCCDQKSLVTATQIFEYKISNIMDKALESICGFISVLPGAFSAYRYEDIKNDEYGKGALEVYFKPLSPEGPNMSVFEKNMYLAEDRILCFELVAKKGKACTLHYCKDAIAYTDVPDTLVSLMKQRRRWANGSFFATVYALYNFSRILTESGHGPCAKFVFVWQFMYNIFCTTLAWFMPGNFFMGIMQVQYSSIHHTPYTNGIMQVIKLTMGVHPIGQIIIGSMAMMVFAQFIMGLGHKPKHNIDGFYIFSMHFFGITIWLVMGLNALMLYQLVINLGAAEGEGSNAIGRLLGYSVMTCSMEAFNKAMATYPTEGLNVFQTVNSKDLRTASDGNICFQYPFDARMNGDDLSLRASPLLPGIQGASEASCHITAAIGIGFFIGCIGLLYVIGVMHGEFHFLVFNTFKYFYLLPTYVFLMGVFSWCNVHDLSWGTKGADKDTGHGDGPEGEDVGDNLEDIKRAKERAEKARQDAIKAVAATKASFKVLPTPHSIHNTTIHSTQQYTQHNNTHTDLLSSSSSSSSSPPPGLPYPAPRVVGHQQRRLHVAHGLALPAHLLPGLSRDGRHLLERDPHHWLRPLPPGPIQPWHCQDARLPGSRRGRRKWVQRAGRRRVRTPQGEQQLHR